MMIICPTCGRELVDVDSSNTEWENHTYYDYCFGRCDYCNKTYGWTEVFTFKEIKDFGEINEAQ